MSLLPASLSAPAQVETQFLLLELDQPRQETSHPESHTKQTGTAAAPPVAAEGSGGGNNEGSAEGDSGGGSPGPSAPASYALLLPLIDSGRFRATLRPPK